MNYDYITFETVTVQRQKSNQINQYFEKKTL